MRVARTTTVTSGVRRWVVSKALFGTHVSAEHRALLEELWRLRARVAELEAALADAQEHAGEDVPRSAPGDVGEEPATP